jgi:hypothetical protein
MPQLAHWSPSARGAAASLLPVDPVSPVRWTPPKAAAAASPQAVATPAQVRAILPKWLGSARS